MVQYAQECSTLGIRYIWDPGQQCARMDGTQLAEGVTGAFMVIVNDYEFELLRQKTGMSEEDVQQQARAAGDHARRARLLGADARARESTCRRSRRIASWIRRASATRSAAAS